MVSANIHDFRASVKSGPPNGTIIVRGYRVKQIIVEELVESMEVAFDAVAKKIGAENSAGHDGLALLGNAAFLLRVTYDAYLQDRDNPEKDGSH